VAAAAGALVVGACARPRAPVGYVPALGTTVLGTASWYGPGFHGKQTASGERYDMDGLTAAHRLWAFGTVVRVTFPQTGRSVVVRINDRFPRRDRVIDLSRGAARALGLIGPGIGRVRLEVIDPERTRAAN
jgi:rare lipoprotein A